MRFYKRDPDAALAGMTELTLQERGAYNTIIDVLYSRDGVLPDDDELLRRMMGCHGNEWKAVKDRLIAKGKLWIESGLLKAKRVDSVLKEAENFSETQRKRAEKRWETEGKGLSNSKKTEEKQKPENASAKMPLTPTATPIATIKYNRSSKENGFEKFYQSFPKRVARRAAEKAYAQALGRADEETILTGAARYSIATLGRDRQYVKHPATWLNSDGWLDEESRPLIPEIPFENCDEDTWRGRMKFYFDHPEFENGQRWPRKWGPIFDDPKTKVPVKILTEFKPKTNGKSHDAH